MPAFALLIRRWLACLVLLAAAGVCRDARAETTACLTLDTLPVEISQPGHYCLDKDFAQDFGVFDIPVRILADQVLLDCNGHAIRKTGAASQQNAIVADGSQQGITVRGCTIDNFRIGIYVPGYDTVKSTGNTFEDNHVIHATYAGIYVSGSNNRVVGNRIEDMPNNENGNPTGILVSSWDRGRGNLVQGNSIANIHNGTQDYSYTVGITIEFVDDTVVADNTITGLTNTGSDQVQGIHVEDSSNVVIRDNVILATPQVAPQDGFNLAAVLVAGTAEQIATVVCRDNVAGHWEGFAGAFQNCTASGNTEF